MSASSLALPLQGAQRRSLPQSRMERGRAGGRDGDRRSQTEAEAADKRDGDTKGALGVGEERVEKKNAVQEGK